MRRLNLLLQFIVAGLLFGITTSCKDDSASSDSGASVEIINATSAIVELNACNIDSGNPATEYLYTIEYLANPAEIDIDGVEFDLTWSDGDEDPNIFTNEFDRNGSTLEFDWCFRFGDTEWFELDLKILADDEQVESNEFNIRVERPDGANKGIQRQKSAS